MRQAGRYMPEYRAIRERHSLLDICRQPELAAAVTLQPVERLDVDAAILFSDLLLPLEPLGIPFDFVKGEGPVIHEPVRTADDVARLRTFDPRESLGHVLATIRLLRSELADRVPLIGFGGAPFTLASYAVEGGPSRHYARTKAPDVRGAGRVASVVRGIVRGRRRLPRRPGRSGRPGHPGLRFLGRRAQPRRLPRVRAAPTRSVSWPRRPPPACRCCTSAPAPPRCSRR